MADVPRFDPATLTGAVNDTVTVRRVFGDAYERGGVTVIPVARLWAATGLGLGDGEGGVPFGALGSRLQSRLAAGSDAEAPPLDDSGPQQGYGGGHGGGGGYGAYVKAVGVYVIDDAGVHWKPSIDVNRVILGGQAVAATAVSAFAAALAVKALAGAASSAASAIANAVSRWASS
ncbi:hypothetical protein Cch01nite_38540 [Cellulomonas chitinilytica]|uniref:Uncharacterized protein n=1 Tax=Cellulomonas chitinilytica TaxID=398759 RepID=A0A919P6G2_9CELL|nr:hypothetical protein [Cellulomonas chitinilytica]GIG23130.1 hypothetical protein Cch01nite_38540 [Cellulomonas chitinilytica]